MQNHNYHYLVVSKPIVLLANFLWKHNSDKFCLNCLWKFQCDKILKKNETLCKNYTTVRMPEKFKLVFSKEKKCL